MTLSNGAVINIAAGATTGTVTVDAPKDDVYKDAGKVEVSIDKATGGNFENLVPSTTPSGDRRYRYHRHLDREPDRNVHRRGRRHRGVHRLGQCTGH
nr:hypothetical protein GCM10020185_29850 [Pseudomonas brassicacearum subsp. brassicacearum]